MAKYEYRTLLYGTPERGGLRRWFITAANADSESAQVGAAEKSRHVGRVWQALHLLETALRELDARIDLLRRRPVRILRHRGTEEVARCRRGRLIGRPACGVCMGSWPTIMRLVMRNRTTLTCQGACHANLSEMREAGQAG